jgi:hypothetical protein
MTTRFLVAWLCAVCCAAWGQTRLDLGQEGKNIDFSNQPLVRPFRTGTALPSSCVTGEMFFHSGAAAGQNMFGCVSPNTWAPEGQGSASARMQVARTSDTVLTIGSDCTTGSPCEVRFGAAVYSIPSQATATVQSGSGLAFLYVASSGAVTVGTPSSLSVSCAGCQTDSPITQFPVDSLPLMTWNVTGGIWDAAGTDLRALLSAGRNFTAGSNVTITQSGSNVTIAANTYSPSDLTSFDRTLVFADYGYSAAAPWGQSAGCASAAGVKGALGEPASLGWNAGASPCIIYYPNGGGGSFPFPDFLSGSSPVNFNLQARYARGAAGDQYLGWAQTKDGTVANFAGIRYSATASQWQCVIRASGADVAAQAIGVTPDTAMHTFAITNNGAANSLQCQIDGVSATASGTIPSGSWFSILGTSTASASAGFAAAETRIHIGGISR